jgi:serine/threonine protein kinase
VVFKAKDKRDGRIVALKKILLQGDDEGVPATSIREIALLKEVSQHRNIVQLLEVINENSKLFLAFEFLDKDLKGYMNSVVGPIDPHLIKSYMYQLVLGINFCHMHRVMHRDLKPQNLLIDSTGLLKIADFGLARAFSIPLPQYTHEVVTLWYRAPEVLLGAKKYSTPLDVWSIGAIFAELANKKPLLPGDSEYDQLMKTFMMFGTPNDEIWPGVSELPDYKAIFPKWSARPLREKVPSLENAGLDLLGRMMIYEPSQRISTKQALKHPYFNDLDRALYAQF